LQLNMSLIQRLKERTRICVFNRNIMGKIRTRVMSYMFSEGRRTRKRQSFEAKRQRTGDRHTVSYFHQIDDPYSHLAAQALETLRERYDIELKYYVVPPPTPGAAPEPDLLRAFAQRDAAKLAEHYGLGPKATENNVIENWPDGGALREKLGHYSGAMFHYGGEWYWGVDRLHYLERRLLDHGAAREHSLSEPMFPPPPLLTGAGNTGAVIEFFASLRSPYTCLAAAQIFDLARAYGATVEIKPVLPMVMRGLPVPMAKRVYIVQDVKRQAERQNIPFGKIADPVGKPVERGMAILPVAMEQGKGEAFLRSFLNGAWAEGIDAGTDKGLRKIAERAGLDWAQARECLRDESWRQMAADNRNEMFSMGLWGVPSFRIGDFSVWGEDRLWQLEEVLKAYQ
jgi:2-hydroxychromene-2-carboxylate isomerase